MLSEQKLSQIINEQKTDKAYILTYNQFETVETEYGNIEILPFWYWLIENTNYTL